MYDENTKKSREAKEKKKRERLLKSKMYKDLVVEFSDKPSEESVHGMGIDVNAGDGEDVEENEKLKKKQKIEESLFVRLPETKEEKKAERKRKRKNLMDNELLDIGDYADIAPLTEDAEDENELEKLKM